MFMVVIGTFAWQSIAILRKIPVTDAFVIVLVTIVTVLTDLAIAVVVVLLSSPAPLGQAAVTVEQQVVIVPDSQTYHAFGCKRAEAAAMRTSLPLQRASDFRYTPCPDCNPPQPLPSSRGQRIPSGPLNCSPHWQAVGDYGSHQRSRDIQGSG